MAQIRNQDIALAVLHDTARSKYAGKLFFDSSSSLFAVYNSNIPGFKHLTFKELETFLLVFIPQIYPDKSITMALVKDILSQLEHIAPKVNFADEYAISFSNSPLSLTDRQISEPVLSLLHFPFPYTPNEPPPIPTFQHYLDTSLVLEDDPKTPDTSLHILLQEMLGYLLHPQIEVASVFFLTGKSHGGKSVFARLLHDIFPDHLVSANSVEDLTTDKFGTADLAGKRLNVCTEEESKYMRSDKFKAIIAGDEVRAQMKFRDSFLLRPRTKFVFMSNSMPSFDQMDRAMLNRIKIIPFFREFAPQERDLRLSDKLRAEVPGIVHWALEGLTRLRQNNFQFSVAQSAASSHALIDLENDIAPAVAIVRNWYEFDDNYRTSISELYDDYRNNWCDVEGRKAMRRSSFKEQMEKNTGLKSSLVWVQEKQSMSRGYPLRRKIDPEIPPLSPLTKSQDGFTQAKL